MRFKFIGDFFQSNKINRIICMNDHDLIRYLLNYKGKTKRRFDLFF